MTDTPLTPHDRTRWLRRGLVWLAYLVAIGAGLKYGFDFGKEISGTVLGVVLAINSAIFLSIVTGMVSEWAFRPRAADGNKP